MDHPLLYEINARHWIAELREKYSDRSGLELGSVPDGEIEIFAERGFTHLWLMGVWPTGPRSRAEALRHQDLRREMAGMRPPAPRGMGDVEFVQFVKFVYFALGKSKPTVVRALRPHKIRPMEATAALSRSAS